MRELEGERFDPNVNMLWQHSMEKIHRYKGMDMIHRPDLWTHVRRVAYLGLDLAKTLKKSSGMDIDLDKVFRMGFRHDDAEIITSDIVAPVKDRMTHQEQEALKQDESHAARMVAKYLYNFPEGSRSYQKYIATHDEYEKGETLEAQVVHLADKWDALGEMLHDIRCGNDEFVARLPSTIRKIQEFHETPIWEGVKEYGFSSIPRPELIGTMPKLKIEYLETRRNFVESMWPQGPLGPIVWPDVYREWAFRNILHFVDPRVPNLPAEKYIFPGWYLDLWKKWGFTPHGSSTTSGIIIS